MSVVAARMWGMAEWGSLRRIADPVVAAAPAGVRLRTRIRPTATEAEALTAMGELLGSVCRGELVERIGLGGLDRTAHAGGARSVNRPSPRCRRHGGQGRLPARWRISTSWGCGVWPPRWGSAHCSGGVGGSVRAASRPARAGGGHRIPRSRAAAAWVSQRRGTVHQDPPTGRVEETG